MIYAISVFADRRFDHASSRGRKMRDLGYLVFPSIDKLFDRLDLPKLEFDFPHNAFVLHSAVLLSDNS